MADSKEWYIVDEKNREAIGPLSTEEILAMLIQGKLDWDDFIFTPELRERKWRRVFEFRDFSSHLKKKPTFPPPKQFRKTNNDSIHLPSLKMLRDSGGLDQANLYRRYPRAPLETRVIVHNNFVPSVGKTQDISERGSFIIINDADHFDLGTEVTATFREVPMGVGTVSTSAVIIRKVDQENGAVGIGLFFYRLSPKLRRSLAGYVIKKLRSKSEGTQEQAS